MTCYAHTNTNIYPHNICHLPKFDHPLLAKIVTFYFIRHARLIVLRDNKIIMLDHENLSIRLYSYDISPQSEMIVGFNGIPLRDPISSKAHKTCSPSSCPKRERSSRQIRMECLKDLSKSCHNIGLYDFARLMSLSK